jgi:hypothetical protein
VARRDDELMNRWADQLAKIEQELYRDHLHQKVWTEVVDEIQRRRPGADATFLVSYSEGYVASHLVRVRRLADTDRHSYSLASLIQKIAVNPWVITRARWTSRYVGNVETPESWQRAFVEPKRPTAGRSGGQIPTTLSRSTPECFRMTSGGSPPS